MSDGQTTKLGNSTVTIKNNRTGFLITRQINQGLSGLSYLDALGISTVERYGRYGNFNDDLEFTYEGMNLSNYSINDFYEESSNIFLDIGKRAQPPLHKNLLVKYLLDSLQKEESKYLDEIKDLDDIDITTRIQEIINNNVIGFIIFPSEKSILISCPNYETFYNFLLGIQDFSIVVGSNKSPRSILY